MDKQGSFDVQKNDGSNTGVPLHGFLYETCVFFYLLNSTPLELKNLNQSETVQLKPSFRIQLLSPIV